jgi:hypothetical protein
MERLPEGERSMALSFEADRLDRLIARRRPCTLAGAAVKLRRLLDPETGIVVGTSPLDVTSLAQVLALIDGLIGLPTHATRPILDQRADANAVTPTNDSRS